MIEKVKELIVRTKEEHCSIRRIGICVEFLNGLKRPLTLIEIEWIRCLLTSLRLLDDMDHDLLDRLNTHEFKKYSKKLSSVLEEDLECEA